MAVTTSGHCEPLLIERAREGARRFGLPFLARGRKQALSELLAGKASALLVYGGKEVTLWDSEGSVAFTPGMARLRVLRLDRGFDDDRLVRLAEFKEGDRILDCTLGLGSDALVAARAVGPSGKVVGVEKSLALLALVSEGLADYEVGPRSCSVEPLLGDAAQVLSQSPSGAYDCVLIDPMFERPRRANPAFEALRRFADYTPLSEGTLRQARRVARRWVVVKGSRYSKDLSKLGLRPEPGPRAATVVWARLPGGEA